MMWLTGELFKSLGGLSPRKMKRSFLTKEIELKPVISVLPWELLESNHLFPPKQYKGENYLCTVTL